MIDWNKIKEEYLAGGITQGELAEKYGVPTGSLRRRAAAEGWTIKRKSRESGEVSQEVMVAHLKTQLEVTDRMLNMVMSVIDTSVDDKELIVPLTHVMQDLFSEQRVIFSLLNKEDTGATGFALD